MERKQVMRRNNAESARLYRERKREEEEHIQDVFEQNERRIEALEKMVDSLSTELDNPQVKSSRGQPGNTNPRTSQKTGSSRPQ